MRGTRQIPLPIEQHIGDAVGGTEVNRGQSSFGSNGGLAHDGTRLHPLDGIGYLTRRIQVLHDVIVL